MAYVSQENKKEKQSALKAVIPKTWKWSVSVNHYSTLVLTIWSAPVDLVGEWHRLRIERAKSRNDYIDSETRPNHVDVNVYYIKDQFNKSAAIMEKIYSAMQVGNHDRSDSMTDYFDVGWYSDIKLGRYDRPFIYTGPQIAQPVVCTYINPFEINPALSGAETTEQKIARLEAENAELRAKA